MHAEQVTDALLATLRTSVPTVIDTLNAEPGSVQVPYPLGYHFAGKRRLGIDEYPAIEVTVADVDLDGFDIGMRAGDAVYQANVVSWSTDPDHETMVRRGYRLARACALVLLAHDAAGPTSTPIRSTFRYRLTRGPDDTTEETYLMGGLMVVQYAIDDHLI